MKMISAALTYLIFSACVLAVLLIAFPFKLAFGITVVSTCFAIFMELFIGT